MKNKLVIFSMIIILSLGISVNSYSQSDESKKTIGNENKIEEWQDSRFGMFIHWGPVTLRGTEIGWSRGHQVPVDDYDNLYKEFNPVLFDAETWVKTAKDAGIKYLVITSKHHDGFCLWPTAYSEYNIMASPYKKDILKKLAKACKKHEIKFCVYFTILDWRDVNYPIHNDGKQPDPNADMNKFIVTIKSELKEIITKYDPYLLWFDGQWESAWTNEMGADLYKYLKGLKKDLIINNRLGKEMSGIDSKKVDYSKMVGDYDTPEQQIGKFNLDFPWESCITICQQWAWKPNDKMKSLQQCLQTLIKTASGGGNLLFNVGPMPDGRIEQRQIDRLKEMGVWLKNYGESIYGTNGGPYMPNDVYSSTRKGNKIYIHLFNPEQKELLIPAISGVNVIQSALLNGVEVQMKQTNGQYHFTLPVTLPDPISNVLVLTLEQSAMKLTVIKTE